jgi:hypothetical protein
MSQQRGLLFLSREYCSPSELESRQQNKGCKGDDEIARRAELSGRSGNGTVIGSHCASQEWVGALVSVASVWARFYSHQTPNGRRVQCPFSVQSVGEIGIVAVAAEPFQHLTAPLTTGVLDLWNRV